MLLQLLVDKKDRISKRHGTTGEIQLVKKRSTVPIAVPFRCSLSDTKFINQNIKIYDFIKAFCKSTSTHEW